jgi:hypothetical protein
MVPLLSLWLPIVLSALFVVVASLFAFLTAGTFGWLWPK